MLKNFDDHDGHSSAFAAVRNSQSNQTRWSILIVKNGGMITQLLSIGGFPRQMDQVRWRNIWFRQRTKRQRRTSSYGRGTRGQHSGAQSQQGSSSGGWAHTAAGIESGDAADHTSCAESGIPGLSSERWSSLLTLLNHHNSSNNADKRSSKMLLHNL